MEFRIKRDYQTPKVRIFDGIIKANDIGKYEDLKKKLTEGMKKEVNEFIKFVNGTFRCLGLSANQCTLNGKLNDESYFYIKGFPDPFIYPIITEKIGNPVNMIETCLSFPGKHIEADRYLKVKVKYMDLEGIVREFTAQGLLAQIIQHEYDHLSGVPEKFTLRTREKDLPRNMPCPCGSGDKYKKCCLKFF